MKRREALKGMGLSIGYAIATPTALSLLQSCSTDIETWTPKFLSPDEGVVIKNLIDIMLPASDSSPGALDVNVPEFIDLYFGKLLDKEGQAKFTEGIQAIISELTSLNGTDVISQLSTENYDNVLAKYLKTSKDEQEKYRNDGNTVFKALIDLRNRSVWAYNTSEKIGEEVLAYDPIPEVQIGCVNLEEATGGKKWSL